MYVNLDSRTIIRAWRETIIHRMKGEQGKRRSDVPHTLGVLVMFVAPAHPSRYCRLTCNRVFAASALSSTNVTVMTAPPFLSMVMSTTGTAVAVIVASTGTAVAVATLPLVLTTMSQSSRLFSAA